MDTHSLFLHCLFIAVNVLRVFSGSMYQLYFKPYKGTDYCKEDGIFLQWTIHGEQLLWQTIYLVTVVVSVVKPGRKI